MISTYLRILLEGCLQNSHFRLWGGGGGGGEESAWQSRPQSSARVTVQVKEQNSHTPLSSPRVGRRIFQKDMFCKKTHHFARSICLNIHTFIHPFLINQRSFSQTLYRFGVYSLISFLHHIDNKKIKLRH